MFALHSPSIVLSHSVHELMRQLPGVRDGSEDAIHQSRVAIRHVSEALALVRSAYVDEVLSGIEDRLRRAARALGRVRDADIGHRLIQHVETRFPLAPVALARLRAAVSAEQLVRRRKVIKKLEGLELDALPGQLARARRGAARFGWDRRSAWRSAIRQHLSLRAVAAREAMAHAGGVYFPHRVHSARIAIKQLRYTLELADATRIWCAPRAVRLLKKAQDVLGDVHDREVLIERLDDLAAPAGESLRAEVDAVGYFIRAETLALHARYIERRPDLLLICDACERAACPTGSGTRALLAAGVGVPSLLLLRRQMAGD